MLQEIFSTLLKMNCIASIVAILLLLIKSIFQKVGCPRRILFFLWAVIAFRLLCPVAPSTELSPFNLLEVLAPTMPQRVTVDTHRIYSTPAPTNDAIYVQVQPMHNELTTDASVTQKGDKKALSDWVTVIWLIGMSIMLLLGIASYLKLKRQLRFAIKLKDNIYTADNIPTSFVFGMIRPKIYVPDGVSAQTMDNIILHEETHIRRHDHIAKIAAYILLSIHWFNPLNWVWFHLFSEDMEIACDESVLCNIGPANKKAYLDSLLRSALDHKRTVSIYHVCFSINPTKRRIAAMIHWKPRSKLLQILAISCCMLVAIAFATNARNRTNESDIADQAAQEIDISAPVLQTQETANPEAETTAVTKAPASQAMIAYTNPNNPKTSAPANAAVTETTTASANSAVKIKSSNSLEVSEINFEQFILEDVNLTSIREELNRQGITQAQSSNVVDLSKNFVVADYSYEKSLTYENRAIQCDDNGNISLYFNINSPNVVGVSFYDSETNEEVGSMGILANDKNVYSFLGFDKDKTYNVKIQGNTKDEWQIEGEYMIY
ncbi:MAG: M56 family metallopeptidase [Clostridia bacterium]|nr:M56 family metallopeptidase [Clostridia bacterium]